MSKNEPITVTELEQYEAQLAHVEELEQRTAADGGETVLPL